MKRILKNRYVLVLILCVLLYMSWTKFTSRWGEQAVDYTPAQKECFVEEKFKYCVYKSVGGVNGGIAYHLHGRNLDESMWNDDTFYSGMVQQYWRDHKKIPPTVVSVSFGPIWLLTPKNGAPKGGLLDVFLNQTIKTVEDRLGAPKYRVIFGESMGGLNSLIASLHTKNVFHKVASLCPALYSITPFDGFSVLKDYIKKTGADPKIVFGIVSLAKNYVTTKQEWEDINPLDLIKKFDTAKAPRFYLSCGLYDPYGNYAGSDKFVNMVKSKGIPMEWHPLYGSHCAVDVNSLAEFLLP